MIKVLGSRSILGTVLASVLLVAGFAPVQAEDIRLPGAVFDSAADPGFVAARRDHRDEDGDQPVTDLGMPHIGQVAASVKILPSVQITDHGRVIYEGPYDVNPTLRRIREGRSLGRHDGTIFKNREGRLPPSDDPGFYLEFRIREDGLPFPGAQRILMSKDGDVYFTGDHYATFHKTEPEPTAPQP